MPRQLPLLAKVRPRNVDPEATATIAIQRRAKASAFPGHLRSVLTLNWPLYAERLSARSIREGKAFEVVLIKILKAGAP